MDCRTPTPSEFGSKLGFDQHDLIMTKGQSVLTKVLKIFAREKTLQHLVLNYRTDLYFPDHKLAIEADEKGHENRDDYKEIEMQKEIEREFDFKFIRIIPDEQNVDMDIHMSKIQNRIVESTKKITKKSIKKSLIKNVIGIKTIEDY